jgi:hypothetical protein
LRNTQRYGMILHNNLLSFLIKLKKNSGLFLETGGPRIRQTIISLYITTVSEIINKYGMICYDMIYVMIWYDMIYVMIWYMLWYDICYGMIYVMIWYMLWYDTFNYNWIETRWQSYNTHIHTNNTENDTKQTIPRTTQKFGRVRAVPRLCGSVLFDGSQ